MVLLLVVLAVGGASDVIGAGRLGFVRWGASIAMLLCSSGSLIALICN